MHRVGSPVLIPRRCLQAAAADPRAVRPSAARERRAARNDGRRGKTGGGGGGTTGGSGGGTSGGDGAGTSGGAGTAGAGGTAVTARRSSRVNPNAFVHPGGLHKKSDMDRMRYLVAAGVEPWLSATTPCAPMRSRARVCRARQRDLDAGVARCRRARVEFESDANAAYLQALMWIVTRTRATPEGRRDLQCLEEPDRGDGRRHRAAQCRSLRLEAGRGRRDVQSTYDGWALPTSRRSRRCWSRACRAPQSLGRSPTPTGPSLAHRQRRSGRHGDQDFDRVARDDRDGGVPRRPDHVRPRASLLKGQTHRADDPCTSGPSPSGTQTDDNQYFTTYQVTRQNTTPDYGYNGVLEQLRVGERPDAGGVARSAARILRPGDLRRHRRRRRGTRAMPSGTRSTTACTRASSSWRATTRPPSRRSPIR